LVSSPAGFTTFAKSFQYLQNVQSHPQITTLSGSPLVQSAASGNHVFVAFGASLGGPVAVWNSTAPNQSITSPANPSTAKALSI